MALLCQVCPPGFLLCSCKKEEDSFSYGSIWRKTNSICIQIAYLAVNSTYLLATLMTKYLRPNLPVSLQILLLLPLLQLLLNWCSCSQTDLSFSLFKLQNSITQRQRAGGRISNDDIKSRIFFVLIWMIRCFAKAPNWINDNKLRNRNTNPTGFKSGKVPPSDVNV